MIKASNLDRLQRIHPTQTGRPNTRRATTGIAYGWLGIIKQCATTETGLIVTGARLYSSTTGLFTSLDPQYQGGDTDTDTPTTQSV